MGRKIQKPNAKPKKAAPKAAAAPGASRALDFQQRVYEVVRQCPYGKAISYGGVAALLGQPRAARAVGHALAMLEEGTEVPWWRVVNRNGEVSIKSADHAPIVQRTLLEREGIQFERDRINWERFGWNGESADVPRLDTNVDFDSGSKVSRTGRSKQMTRSGRQRRQS